MKRIIISLLLAFLVIGLSAQSSPEPKGQSLELNIGIGKIGVFGNDGYILGLNNPPNYEAEYITKKGRIELNSRLTSNWTFSKKHVAIVGINFNVWSYKASVSSGDVLSNWAESSSGKRSYLSQLDFLAGYRYLLKEHKSYSLFVENVFHGKLISINEFPGLKFSAEPAVGMKVKVTDDINILSVVSYIQPFGNSEYDEIFQNSLGLRLGINKKM